ncbi:sulfate permease, SulP family [Raineyella antarctica]|uniref:Sulfate permease, SulP family n=1 Tax=Raineyella antarctica TaxID=1577474 RepID=A0A1G6GGN6_9ACTN|nr:SulP family inorganic anion transporter [Raineyella antarctica]SDB81157.1 sulfate permease, SulP family [Raineyella antarctica]
MVQPATSTGPRGSRGLLRGLFPGVQVLRHYQRGWLRGDVLGGVTVAAYLVPQVMAYAVVAGMPPVVGLWATVGPLLVYVVLGSSRQLSVGPESTTALMTAAGVAGLVGALGPGRSRDVAAALALGTALICLVGWVARLGFLADLLSRPVLVGYMTGIGVLMVTSQLGALTGLDVSAATPYGEVAATFRQLSQAHLPTLLISGIGLVMLFVLRRLAPRLPGALVFVLLAALASWILGLGDRGVRLVGQIPRGLPDLGLPDLTGIPLGPLLAAALGVTVVGYSDVVLTGRSFASRRGEPIDSNQEFLALGAANLTTGLSGGFPVSCSGSRTALGDTMGTRTQLHSLVAVGFILLTVFAFGPALAQFPRAALGAVVVFAAVGLVEVREWRRIARFRRSELALAVLTTAGVLTFGVLQGIGIAIALSILELLRRLARPHDGILGRVPGLAGMHDVDDYPDAVQVPGLVVYRYDAPLFFANADNFIRRALEAVDVSSPPARWLLVNAEANVEVDITAVDVLQTLADELQKRGVQLALARVKQDMRDDLASTGFLEVVGEDFIFPTLPTAVAGYEDWVGKHPEG